MVDSHSALTKRHKASLQSFIDKNDWIQGKIDFLERSTLPAIDAESWSLDDAALSQLLQEHERLEAEVQDVDNGELQALRLLAKGGWYLYASPAVAIRRSCYFSKSRHYILSIVFLLFVQRHLRTKIFLQKTPTY